MFKVHESNTVNMKENLDIQLSVYPPPPHLPLTYKINFKNMLRCSNPNIHGFAESWKT